jgi:hypothetical protein
MLAVVGLTVTYTGVGDCGGGNWLGEVLVAPPCTSKLMSLPTATIF